MSSSLTVVVWIVVQLTSWGQCMSLGPPQWCDL